ncbi:hypothetical protein BAUCODRAFT_37905 [Baudoinia panamericana UAMH 10762]|uniref:Major facilitator superfamily (MFS) profile domain-containing protein n=1 Tax=Baudoinia panamericana (strain UAMH 10762) TaxID=717646 RepID=M2LG51_BAUPA|nr:uncharacterized protein BAUCODRAFT_37905 [Baudoinia panamericana UAMH 10762]EMC92997.1 hypothetical protein BAUCODRAFT_37905 [Baudoinia panamericana UAMH 10762]
MVLTRQQALRPLRDPNKFPTVQLCLLALVRAAEPIAIFSVLPYAWQYVRDFHVGDPANASFYAGVFVSTFNLAEAISGMYWGGISDKIGRKPVLIMGCFATIASLLIVGFSINIWMALIGRLVGGLFNGNVGVIQTMVGEIVINPEHEPKAYAVMPFVWSVGIIVGPAVGGYFTAPTKNFPGTIVDIDLFRQFPYALPNIICALLMLISILGAYFLLEETHPDMSPYGVAPADRRESVTPLFVTQGTAQMPASNLANESYGTFNEVNEDAVDESWNVREDGTSRPASLISGPEKWLTRRIVLLMIALGIFTYHSMTYDHLMPIFFQDDRRPLGEEMVTVASTIGSKYGSFAGGLGLTVKQCGIILAFNGIIALFVQAVIFPLVAGWLGVWRTFVVVTVLHPIAYFIVPWLALLPENMVYPGIYICLTVRNLVSIMAYPTLLILIKEASPSNNCLGRINGLAASTGAGFRTIAAPITGAVYGVGQKIEFTALAWWLSALVALTGAFQVFTINRLTTGPQHSVCGAVPCKLARNLEHGRRKSSVVRIRVHQNQDSGYHSEDDDERTPFASRVPR